MIKNMSMFLAMRNLFFGGEFSAWIVDKSMPVAAMKEFEEAEEFFCNETGFDTLTGEEFRAKKYPMPAGYEPQVGDIVSFDNRKTGMRQSMTIGIIVENGFFLSPEVEPPKMRGPGFHNDFQIIVKVQRPIPNQKNPKKINFTTVWESPIND